MFVRWRQNWIYNCIRSMNDIVYFVMLNAKTFSRTLVKLSASKSKMSLMGLYIRILVINTFELKQDPLNNALRRQ